MSWNRIKFFGCLLLACSAAQWMIGGCDVGLIDGSGAGRALPALRSATALSRHYVEVTFAVAPGSGAENPSRYAIRSLDGDSLDVFEVLPTDSREVLVLRTDTHAAKDYVLKTVGGPGGTAAGSSSGQVRAGAEVVYTGDSSVEPQLLSAIALSNTSVLLTFDTNMDETSTGNKNHYRIDTPDLNITTATFDAIDKHSVTLVTSPQDDLLYTVTVGGIKSGTGKYIDPAFSSPTFYGIAATDNTAPKLINAEATSASTVRLTFSEPLENFVDDPVRYTIAPNLAVLGASPDMYGTQVLLYTLRLTVGTQYTVTVSNVEDRAGNVVSPEFSTATFTFNGAITEPSFDNTPPRVIAAKAITNTLVDVHFNKPMGPSGAEYDRYGISGVDGGFVFVGSAMLSPDRMTARLTTSSQADILYTVQAVGVKDSEGNPIAPPSSSLLAVVGLDPTKATFMGIAPSSIDQQTDSDGDGFADWFETLG